MEGTISVIIPVYNSEKTLDYCLKSVLRQTYTNLQIILVESASTDRSREICDEYERQDSRVQVLHQAEKKGLSNARNEGLKLAKGDYIGYVDSDDWITLDMFEILHDTLIRENADISCGGVKRVENEIGDNATGKEYSYKVYSKEEYAKKFFRIGTNKVVHYVWNKLYRRKIAEKIVFPEGLIAEDVEGFFYALVNSIKIIDIDRDMYYYRYNPDGLSSDWFSKKQMDIITVWRHVYEYCIINKIDDWIYYAEMNYYRAYFGVLTRLLISGKSQDFPDEKNVLLKWTRRYYWKLIRFPMPKSRKILMTSMCINYPVTEKIYQKVSKSLKIKILS